MNLSGIISITGMSGLYKVIAQTKSGLIVESLVDKKRVPAYAQHRVSTLEDVSIYSTGDDVPLKVVLQKIYEKENGAPCIDHKKPDAELKSYLKSAFPDYDEGRVHMSDIKKVLNWYNILQKAGLLEKEEEKTEEKLEEAPAKISKGVEAKAPAKTKIKEKTKPAKTASSKVKTQGVRKTGVA